MMEKKSEVIERIKSEAEIGQTKIICAWLFGTMILVALLIFVYQIGCNCHA